MSILYLFVVVIVVVVKIYNFTKGHNISLPRFAPLPLSIILLFVIKSSVINAKWRKIKYKYIGVYSQT